MFFSFTYNGTASSFHPEERAQKVAMARLTELRGWLMMACGVMRIEFPQYYNTMQAGAVIDTIAGLVSSAAIPKKLCEDEFASYPQVNA